MPIDDEEFAAHGYSYMIVEAGELLKNKCHRQSLETGWWKGIDLGALDEVSVLYIISSKLILVHSEISEAFEGARKNLMDDHLPHRKMIEVELADAIIRICDLAGALNLDLGGAIEEKLRYNAQREDHKLEHRMKEGGKKV